MRLRENPSLRLRRSPLALTRRIPKKASPGNRERASERACEGARTTARGRERERERERERARCFQRHFWYQKCAWLQRACATTFARLDAVARGQICALGDAGHTAAAIRQKVFKKDKTRPSLRAVEATLEKHRKEPSWRGANSFAGGRPWELCAVPRRAFWTTWAFRSQFLRYVALSTWSL